MKNTKNIIFKVIVVFGLLFFCGGAFAQTPKPNVVIIYVDDLGYGDLSCYGATEVQTPNVDKLAENGIVFTDAHCSSSTCTPSRYSLLTGSYAFRNNASILPGDAPLIIDLDTPTLPGMLQKNGYKTAVIGKWHLGLGDGDVDWNGKITPGPLEVGFDYSYLIPATGDRVPCVMVENHHVVGLDPEDPIQVSYKKKVGTDPTGLEQPELLRYQADKEHSKTIVNGVSRIGYMSGGNSARWNDETVPHQMLHKARQFMNQNQDNPFFLYFAFHDIHVPRLPDYRFKGTTDMGVRGDAIVQMDWVTGQLMQHLENLGVSENTMIIFSSDNGPVLNDGYEDKAIEMLGEHKPGGPFRGGKYSAYEAATRVPTIVQWPGVIQPGKSDALIGHTDFYASIASIVGHELTEKEAPDSYNLINALTGKSKKGRDFLMEQSYTYSLRKGNYKYIKPVKKWKPDWIEEKKGIESGSSFKPQLFDLSKDIWEENNLADKKPKLVKQMQAELSRILNEDQSR
ncbi:sulfatase family protein [Marinilabilia rubra]|uniref:Arylsulfatase n=1 Tax=Marinilabilia rubra TaxID=2162893 RepID=A0A2U2B7C5_9BACT|nr:arylsulfatase [Marinilabilia rubra]PWD98981.1 arylsulfatase [Marinilabilia rubra]